jgi:hypothetical protein
VADLITRLRAALAEIERVARATSQESWEYWSHYIAQCFPGDQTQGPELMAHMPPSALLDMVAAHRKILAPHTPMQWAFKWIGPSDDPANRVPDMRCSACWTDYDPDGKYDRECHHDPHEWPCDTVKALAEGYGVEV